MILKNVTYLDENFNIATTKYLTVKAGRFAEFNDTDDIDFTDTQAIDCSGLLIMPAFYNTHAHSPMSLMRGFGENMALDDWLNKKIWPFEAHLNSDSIYSVSYTHLDVYKRQLRWCLRVK